jgi:hypothetical protein
VTEQLDPYGTWGDWDLRKFKVEVARWRDTTHPPPPGEIYELVDRWWPRLKQAADRTGAVKVSEGVDPQGNLWWMWVPRAGWLDDSEGYMRVQCYFRVHRDDQRPWLECEEIRTVQSMTPVEVDRADGMG